MILFPRRESSQIQMAHFSKDDWVSQQSPMILVLKEEMFYLGKVILRSSKTSYGKFVCVSQNEEIYFIYTSTDNMKSII